MSRAIELGRAVIAMPSANIELWLTTLITLSPQHDANNLPAQLNSDGFQTSSPNALLDYLSSGEVWVQCANAMHMTFDLTMFGQPLDSNSIRQLGDNIINAPAWRQLNLSLTFPVNYQSIPGKLRINIDQLYDNDQLPNKAIDKAADSQSTHVRPPEGMPIILLESIGFAVTTFETKNNSTARRRPKREATKRKLTVGAIDALMDDEIANPVTSNNSNPDFNFSKHEEHDRGFTKQDENGLTQEHVEELATPNSKTALSLTPVFVKSGKRKRSIAVSESSTVTLSCHVPSSLGHIVTLIDAVLRFSICLNLRGSICSLKVKANTFVYGLADVAPAVWRLGFLSTCSQTTHLAPSLSRSLSRISSSAKSRTLKAKITALTGSAFGKFSEESLAGDGPVGNAELTLTIRMWVHNQNSQLSKALPGNLQPLCVPRSQASLAGEPEDILQPHGHLVTFGHTDVDISLEESPLHSRIKRQASMGEATFYDEQFHVLHEVDRSTHGETTTLEKGTGQSQFNGRSILSSFKSRFTDASRTSIESVLGEEELVFPWEEPLARNMTNGNLTCQNERSTEVLSANQVGSILSDGEDILFSL